VFYSRSSEYSLLGLTVLCRGESLLCSRSVVDFGFFVVERALFKDLVRLHVTGDFGELKHLHVEAAQRGVLVEQLALCQELYALAQLQKHEVRISWAISDEEASLCGFDLADDWTDALQQIRS